MPNRLYIAILFLPLIISISTTEVLAANIFRILGGAGLTQTKLPYEDMELFNHHYGIQFLHYVVEKYAYGLEVMHHQVFKSKRGEEEYLSVCIILETKPYKILLKQMGLAGYIGRGDNRLNPFGFRVSTGVEIPIRKKTLLSILLRKDIIFEKKTIFSSSIELGAGVRF